MKRLVAFLKTPFGVAALGCLLLIGWALSTGGAFDSALAGQARTSSIALAPGIEMDKAAAERVVGNRRLVVVFLEPGGDLRDGCHDVDSAAEGTLVLLLGRDDDGFTSYGCSQLPGGDENLGKSVVAESRISSGIDQFADDPITALKIIAVNYDLLVKAGIVPDGPRTISPPLPRYLIAAAALGATLAGAALAYHAARRAGRVAAHHRDERDHDDDARTTLSAEAAILARRIITLDAGTHTKTGKRAFRELAADYADLAADVAAADTNGPPDPALLARVRELTARSESLNT